LGSSKSKAPDENEAQESAESGQAAADAGSSGLKREIKALEWKLIQGKEKLVRAEVELASARAKNRNSSSHTRAQVAFEKCRDEFRGLKTSKQDMEERRRVLKDAAQSEVPPFGWMGEFCDLM
jgi:hypothetical protein